VSQAAIDRSESESPSIPPTTVAVRSAEAREATPFGERVRVAKDIFTVGAFLVAGIWAVSTFYYQSIYVPAHEQLRVTPKMTLTVVGEKDNRLAVSAHLELKNESGAERKVWATSFYAFGQKVTLTPSSDRWQEKHATATSFEGSRDFAIGDERLLASEIDLMTQPGRNNPIQAHAEFHRDFFFYVDKGAIDTVRVWVDVMYSNDPYTSPKAEWFTVKEGQREGMPGIESTPACKADGKCEPNWHIQFGRQLSLWK
jgi:hypothetical protein